MKKQENGEFRIDCIRMKRDIQRQISAETKGMSAAERLAYYKRLAKQSPFKPNARRPGQAK